VTASAQTVATGKVALITGITGQDGSELAAGERDAGTRSSSPHL